VGDTDRQWRYRYCWHPDPVNIGELSFDCRFPCCVRACTITGVVAMLSNKGRGRHSNFGTIYYWCLSAVFISASALALVRWAEDYHLFILGALSFAAASWGRTALRRRWRHLASSARYRSGCVLRSASDGVLCEQWKEPAGLAGASRDCFLVAANRDRSSSYWVCAAEPSTGQAIWSLSCSTRVLTVNRPDYLCGDGVEHASALDT
jgi:hypothetical protein